MTFPQRVTGLLLAGAIAAALLFYAFGKVDSWLGRRDADTTARSSELVRLHAGNQRWRAKLEAAERRRQADAARAAQSADALRLALARGERVDTVKVLQEIATQDSTAYAKCAVVVLTCQQRATHAEQEADRLATQLHAQMQVRDHRCGIYAGVGPAVFLEGAAPGARALAANLSLGCRLLRLPLLP
jgi:hypothetical protein